MSNYVSHMRAQGFDESEQPVVTIDGQHISVDALQVYCDGQLVAEYSLFNHKWYVRSLEGVQNTPCYVHRIAFFYVDSDQRTLPDN